MPYDIYLNCNICYFNNFDRTWKFILSQLVLESNNCLFLMRFKTFNSGQIDIFFFFFNVLKYTISQKYEGHPIKNETSSIAQ